MSCLLFSALVGGGCLILGWMVLPAPRAVTDFWVRQGWARRPT